MLHNQQRDISSQYEKLSKELQDQEQKLARSQAFAQQKLAKAKQKKVNLEDTNPHVAQMQLDIQNNLNKTLSSCIL